MGDLTGRLSKEVMTALHREANRGKNADQFRNEEGTTFKLVIALAVHKGKSPTFESVTIRSTCKGDHRAGTIRPATKDDLRNLGELVCLLAGRLQRDLLDGIPPDNAGFLYTSEISKLRRRRRIELAGTLRQSLGALWKGAESNDKRSDFLGQFLSHRDQLWHLICFVGKVGSTKASQNLVWWLNLKPDDVSFVRAGTSDPITGSALKDALSRVFPKECLLKEADRMRFQRMIDGYASPVPIHKESHEGESHSELVDEVLAYLEDVVEKCGELPYYFPAHLRSGTNNDPFGEMQQRVRVVEDHHRGSVEGQRVLRQHDQNGIEHAGDMPHRSYGESVLWSKHNARCFKQAVISGRGGLGKTWLLRGEARQLAHRAIDVIAEDRNSVDVVELPIFVRLPDLAHGTNEETLEDLIVRQCAEGRSTAFEKYLRERLGSVHGVVLLDAWDEVSTLDQKRHLSSLVRAFAEKSAARILMTSRPVDYDLTAPPLPGGEVLEILTWDSQQVWHYVRAWFGSNRPAASHFLASLDRDAQVRGLAEIPLMLQLLCSACPDGEFPSGRSNLYRRCLRGLLRDWHIQDKEYLHRRTKAQLSDTYIAALVEVLEDLALDMHERGVWQYQVEEARPVFEGFLEKIYGKGGGHELVKEGANPTTLCERFTEDGILMLSASADTQTLRFIHGTFQEYLVARAVAKRSDSVDVALAHLYDPSWEQALILLGGTLRSAGVVVAAPLRANREDPVCRPFVLAVRTAAEAGRECLPKALFCRMAREITEICLKRKLGYLSEVCMQVIAALPESVEVLTSALAEGQLHERRLASKALSLSSFKSAVPVLHRALRDHDAYVRANAAKALGSMGSDESVAVLEQALQDQDRPVQVQAAMALGQIGSLEAISSLERAMSNGDLQIRSIVPIALGRSRSKHAVPILVAALQDEFRAVRAAVVDGLAEIIPTGAIPYLIMSTLDGRADVCSYERVMEIFDSREVHPPLKDLSEKSEDAIRNVIENLGMAGDNNGVTYLVQALQDRTCPLRHEIPRALQAIGSSEARLALVRTLHDEDARVQAAAAISLGRMRSRRAVAELLTELQAGADRVRECAAWALGRIGLHQAVPELTRALDGAHVRLRYFIIQALGRIGCKEVIAPSLDALSDPTEDPAVQEAAASALGNMRCEQACPDLLAALRRGPDRVRAAVAWALGTIGLPTAVPGLVAAFHEKNSEIVYYRIVEALGQIGLEASVPVLVEALANQYESVVRNAAIGLVRIGSSSSVSALRKALGGPEFSVRNAVIVALCASESEDVIFLLQEALADPDPSICEKAAWALSRIDPGQSVTALSQAFSSGDDRRREGIVRVCHTSGIRIQIVPDLASQELQHDLQELQTVLDQLADLLDSDDTS